MSQYLYTRSQIPSQGMGYWVAVDHGPWHISSQGGTKYMDSTSMVISPENDQKDALPTWAAQHIKWINGNSNRKSADTCPPGFRLGTSEGRMHICGQCKTLERRRWCPNMSKPYLAFNIAVTHVIWRRSSINGLVSLYDWASRAIHNAALLVFFVGRSVMAISAHSGHFVTGHILHRLCLMGSVGKLASEPPNFYWW